MKYLPKDPYTMFPPTLPFLFLLALLIHGCGEGGDKGAPPAAPPPLTVAMGVTKPVSLPVQVEVVGQLEGSREVEVRARVAGILQERLYQEGLAVEEGDLLFRIDPAPYEIALAQAKGVLAEQQARLGQTTREAGRLQGLVAKNAISQKEYDNAASSATISQATLQAAEARVREAELNLSYTRVTAPVSGLTGRALHDEGALVSPGAEGLLTTLVQIEPIRVRFSLSEGDLARLPKGRLTQDCITAVSLVLPDGSLYPEEGRMDFAGHRVDPRLGTVEARAEFDNGDKRLMPGQFVRVRLMAGEREGVYKLPQTAILQSDKGHFVYVVGSDGKATVRPVRTGEWSGSDWIILEGLKPGEKVILDNLVKVRPGADVVEAPPAGAPGKETAKP